MPHFTNRVLWPCLLTIGLLSCDEKQPMTSKLELPVSPVEIQPKLPSTNAIPAAEIYTLIKVPRESEIRCTGTIHAPPQNRATVSVPMGGFVKRIVPIEGQYMKKGQTVAVFEHPDYLHLQQQYLDAIADLRYLEKENNRQEVLAEANAGTGRVKEKTASELQSAKIKVAALAKELRWLRINPDNLSPDKLQMAIYIPAPFSGYVGEIYANPGKYLDQNTALLEMTDVDHLHLELQVYEQDVRRLREGQLVEFNVGTEAKGKTYQAEVFQIGQLVNPESRSLGVHCHLTSSPKNLKPGTFVEAQIKTATDSLVFVPREGVHQSDGQAFVYVVEREQLQKQSVEIISTDQEGVFLDFAERLVGKKIWIGSLEEEGEE